MDEPKMPALLVSHRRPGFYLRVLEEGDVGAGDEIKKVADGPEHMSVAEIDALLYLPGHPRDSIGTFVANPRAEPRLERFLASVARSGGRRQLGVGNPGLTAAAVSSTGMARLSVPTGRRVDRESANVVSLSFEATDGSSLPAALPGQFLVLRLRTKPELPAI